MDKYVPRKIINAHTHYHPGELEQVAERWMAAGLKKTCMCAWSEPSNPETIACYKRFPNLVVPFGYVNLHKPDPDDVDRRRDEGFFGVKFITTPVPFSSAHLMPIYERAARYNMPAVFHTGWVAAETPERSLNMHPCELEPIARAFPHFRIVAAHLGNWWAEDAVGIMQHHANVYFDLSGGFIRRMAPSKLRGLFSRQIQKNLRVLADEVDPTLFQKIVFATDNPPLEELLEFYVNLMTWLEVPVEIQDMVYYHNMARILGLES